MCQLCVCVCVFRHCFSRDWLHHIDR
jgi:hypothetical protein